MTPEQKAAHDYSLYKHGEDCDNVNDIWHVDYVSSKQDFLSGAQWQRENGWISIWGAMPENGESILATNGMRTYYCVFDRGQFYRQIDNIGMGDRCISIYYNDITHWQPLPTPPKTKEDGR